MAMTWTEEQNTVILLAKLKELEGAVSAFYAAFAEKAPPADKAFWLMLSKAEYTHMRNIDRMKDIFRKKKSEFSIGIPLDWHDVENVTIGIRGKTELVEIDGLKPETFLAQAKQIETGILESKYNEIIKAKDPEYISLCSLIVAETRSHYQAIEEKLKMQK